MQQYTPEASSAPIDSCTIRLVAAQAHKYVSDDSHRSYNNSSSNNIRQNGASLVRSHIDNLQHIITAACQHGVAVGCNGDRRDLLGMQAIQHMRTLAVHIPDSQVAIKVCRANQLVMQQFDVVAAREAEDGFGAVATRQIPNLDRPIMTSRELVGLGRQDQLRPQTLMSVRLDGTTTYDFLRVGREYGRVNFTDMSSQCMLERHKCTTSHRIASHRIASHRIASHRIASHRIASHRIASHRIASHQYTLLQILPPLLLVDARRTNL
jgi:hypothetical protein